MSCVSLLAALHSFGSAALAPFKKACYIKIISFSHHTVYVCRAHYNIIHIQHAFAFQEMSS